MIDRTDATGTAPPAAPSPGNEGAELGLRDLLRIVRRRGRLIASIVVPAMLLAALVVSLLPAVYTAEALVLIEDKPVNIMSVDKVAGGQSGDKETVQSEAFVLSSRRLAGGVIERLNFVRDEEFNPDYQETDKPPPSRPQPTS